MRPVPRIPCLPRLRLGLRKGTDRRTQSAPIVWTQAISRMPDSDSSEIEFQCPSCGHELKQTVAGLKAERRMICPGCGIGINIDTDKLANAAEEMQKAIDKTPSEITIKFFR
jgi:transcription elongation factor Elf1